MGQRLPATAKDGFDCIPPSGKHFTPERDFGHLPSHTSSKDVPRESKTYSLSSPVLKRVALSKSEQKENAPVVSVEKEGQGNYVMHAPSERALKQKPMSSYKRSAPSPSFSVKSYESDQYTELPTVIHVSRRDTSGSKDSSKSIPTRTLGDQNFISAPVSDMRSRPPADNRLTKLVSRDKRLNSSPSLPSKPRVDVKTKHVQKS